MLTRDLAPVFLLPVSLLVPAAMAQPWALPNFAQRLEMDAVNRSQRAVTGLAVVPVRDAARVAPGFPGSLAIAVVLNPTGSAHPFTIAPSQVDDLDGDGTPDELLFSVTLPPGATRRVHIYYSTTLHDTIPYPKEVDAAHNFGYNHQTAGLESKKIGYRTYGGFLLDVQGRTKENEGLNNNLVGYLSASYPTAAGSDALHVGDTLGLGGIFLRRGGVIYRPPFNVPDYAHKPSPREVPQYRVVATGPLRASIEAKMDRWTIGQDAVRLLARYSIGAGEESVNCEIEIAPLSFAAGSEYEVGAGVLELPEMRPAPGPGRIALSGMQEARLGPLALAMFFDPQEAGAPFVLRTNEGANQAVLFRPLLHGSEPVRFRYRVTAAWSGSGIDDLLAHLLEAEREARQRIELSRFTLTRTPDPLRVEGEAY